MAIILKMYRRDTSSLAIFQHHHHLGTLFYPAIIIAVVVGFAFPCGDSKSVKLLRSQLPKGAIDLSLASIGQVKVQLLDMEGANWKYPIKVSLVPEPGDGNPDSLSRFQIGHGYGHAITNANGCKD